MTYRSGMHLRTAFVAGLILTVATGPSSARGGRGGGGGGGRGMGGGGGGGVRGGGGMQGGGFRPAGGGMAHTPSFNNMGGARPAMSQGNISRPNVNPGTVNRGNANIGEINRGNPNIGNINRNNININRNVNGNRENLNAGNINRNNINTGNINRNNNNVNINRNNFNDANINRNNNYYAGNLNRGNYNNYGGGGWGYGGGYGPTLGGGGWGPGYYGGRYGPGYWGGYHSGWQNGYWNNNWGGFGTGLGVGVLGWSLGSSIYNSGYSTYSNPYYSQPAIIAQQPQGAAFAATGYDYSQPINTELAPPADTVIDEASQSFDEARSLFKAGDYPNALVNIDNVLKQTPSDSAAHEFRALVQFAMKSYELAAGTLYAVLSVGPGWDWSTMVGLYPDVETYTTQLRALEEYCRANPNGAGPIFVLGYHYLTMGQTDAAKPMFQRVTKLQPNDKLALALFDKLGGTSTTPATNPATAAVATTPESTVPKGEPQPASAFDAKTADLVGSWKAQPTPDVTINLTFTPDGKFTWVVDQKGKKNTITGESTLGNDLLTLAGSGDGTVMVGNTNWADASHFKFKIANGPSDDPGLSLVKQ